MNTRAKSGVLRPLVEILKTCPARDENLAQEKLRQAWARFQRLDWEEEDEHLPAVLAGMILYDEQFARLLNEAERSQLEALAKLALERYQQIIHPPNQLGKIIAATLKESK